MAVIKNFLENPRPLGVLEPKERENFSDAYMAAENKGLITEELKSRIQESFESYNSEEIRYDPYENEPDLD